MTAAKMIERPSFDLMHQDDTRSHQYMQMPLWLFDDPRCSDLSLDAKVIYTLLLNRFCLSCRNNWTNEYGEVFVVYPRQELAAMLHICEQRVSVAMRALIDSELVWERRCGRGFPNQIYIARITNDDTGDFAPNQEPQNQPDMPLNTRDSKTANSEHQEPQDLMYNTKEENLMSEIKQTNFRIDQESADAFRAYCEESGLTQAQGFDHLLHVLELNRAKTAVPGRLTEISDFENHLQCILATYVQSIALAENTESRVRSDYDEHISIKEEQILALEDELRYAQYSISACNATEIQLKALQDDLDRAHADLQEAENVRHLLEEQHCNREADKQRIIDMLTTNLAIAEEKATSYDTLLADHDRLANELQRALDAAKEQTRIYERDLESAARTAERTLDAALSTEKENCAVLVWHIYQVHT